MYCTNCGNKSKEGANFCGNCGGSVKEISHTENIDKKAQPEIEKVIKKIEDKDKVNFFIVPTGRLVIFSILSFGFYSVYWFAKNFYALKERRKLRGKKTKEWWAIGNAVMSNLLFSEFYLIHKEATGKKFKVPSWVFAILYFVLIVSSSYLLLSPIVFIATALIFQSVLKKYEYIGFYNYKKAKFNKKELGIIFVGIAIVLLSYWSQSGDISNTKLTYSDLQEIASDANKDLPEMIDEGTRIDYVTGGDGTLTYNYTLINNDKTDFEYNFFQKSLKEEMTKNICTNPDYDSFIENNIVLKYKYFDKNKILIDEITIFTGADCSPYN